MSFSQGSTQPMEGPYVENPGYAAQPPVSFFFHKINKSFHDIIHLTIK